MEAPIMLLTGHQGEIYTAKFHPEGNVIASAGFERNICKHKSSFRIFYFARIVAHQVGGRGHFEVVVDRPQVDLGASKVAKITTWPKTPPRATSIDNQVET